MPGGADSVQRVQGVDRFATAIAASKRFDRAGGEGGTVVIANYEAWADIIAASPLAAELNANVLYSYAGKLESRTKEELVRLAEEEGVTNVLFIGGSGVLTQGLWDEVEDMEDDDEVARFSVDRIGGETRYDTAGLLAAETVNSYQGSTAVADARAAVRQNAEDQNAVATAKADVAEANAAFNRATTEYANAVSALNAALVERGNLVEQLSTKLTDAEEEALRDEITAAEDTSAVAYNNLVAAIVAGEDTEELAEAYADAQEVVADLQEELEGSVNAEAGNAPILDKIEAIDARLDGNDGLVQAADDAAEAWVEAGIELQVAIDALEEAEFVADEARDNEEEVVEAYNDALDAAVDAAEGFPKLVATGSNFADALAAGPVAASVEGVVLLTNGATVPEWTDRYLDIDSDETVWAIGGAAADAVDTDEDREYVGIDRYETAAMLAEDFQGVQVALASGFVSADAVIAGAIMANVGGNVLLTKPSVLPAPTKEFFTADYTTGGVVVFGGTGAVAAGVATQVKTIIGS